MLGLHCCVQASYHGGISCCRAWALGPWASVVVLHSMWNLPRPGIKPVSPALAGERASTAPPGKFLLSLWHMKLSAWSKQYCKALLIKDSCDGSVLRGKVNLTDASSHGNHLILVPIVEILGDILLREMTFPCLVHGTTSEGPPPPCLPGSLLHILLNSAQITLSGKPSVSLICLPRWS